ncbi:MAG: hypothetical protein LBH47_02580 [Christensenellaceae bacterium]|jgi:hypothetical protein|nr:hypothetical protein [Christensenellaceae bacterium]
MVVEFGNLPYFVPMLLVTALCLAGHYFLRNKSYKTKYWTLFGVLIFNAILHFMKFLYVPDKYDSFDIIVRSISLENVCSVSSVLFPIIYLSKQSMFKNGMVYLGIISGIISFLYPTEALGKDLFSIDIIRFYLQHGIVWVVPVLMLSLDLHSLRFKELHHVLSYTILVFAFIYTSQAIVYGSVNYGGILPVDKLTNNSFQWTITKELGDFVYVMLTWASPPIIRNYPFISVLPSILIYFTFFSMIVFFIYKKSKTKK